jgi:rhodanese-related sulfurtransferase/DNA-binding transcriptional ArsR family regulator
MQSSLQSDFIDQVYEQFAELCKAFSNTRRLQILDLLAQGEHSVEEVARKSRVSVASASQHLQNLKTVHLVKVRREGVKAYYSLADENVCHVTQAIYGLGEKLVPEIASILIKYTSKRTENSLISSHQLIDELKDETVLLIDVRPSEEYRFGHISGAISIPLSELYSNLEQIQKNIPIVAYCRGPYSLLSDEAVSILANQGMHAKRLENGFTEWKLNGYPIETMPEFF